MAPTRNITKHLLENTYGPGDDVRMVLETKGATKLSPTLAAFFENWRRPSDKTVGRVSNALAYSRTIRGRGRAAHKNMIRLIKGGHINVCEVDATPPTGSAAHRDSPYGDRFYVLTAGACPADLDPGRATFMGARRGRARRRRR